MKNNIPIKCHCRDWVQVLLLLDEQTQAQLVQYNKFIENRFKNQVLVRVTTTRHDYEWIEQQGHGLKYESLSSGISSEGLSVLLLSSVLGRKGFQGHANCYRVLLSFFSGFPVPHSWRISHIIYPFTIDLGPPSIDHAGYYSSARPISHLPKTLCELRRPRPHCSGVIFSLMQPERQLNAFNKEVTVSP